MKHLLEQRIGIPAQQKCVYKFLGYDFRVEYKIGKTNTIADTLSRLPTINNPNSPLTQPDHNQPTQSPNTPSNQPNPNQHNQSPTEPIIQAISMIQAKWIEELKKTYPQYPQLQELLSNYHQGALDLSHY